MKRNKLIFLALTVLLTLPIFFGLLHKGFFLSDDGNWMVIRFSAFYENLRGGQFPVRFLSRLNNGYGYPVADFLYPLFMYLAVPIHLLKINFVDTIKIVFGLSFILSSVFSFLWFRKIFNNLSSLVGALAYTLFPYHVWDMYKRGSIGEVLSLSVVPFILWAIEMESLPLMGLGYAMLILAHNSLALLFIPILFLYQLLKGSNKKSINSLRGLELGLLISCFFWLPALYDKQFTVFDKTNVSDFANYFVSDFNLFGLISVVSIIGSLAFLRLKDRRFIYFFIVSIVAIFLSTSLSLPIWQRMPFINLIQFPFRILSIFVLASSYLIAYQVEKINFGFSKPTAICIVTIIFISAWPFLVPQSYQYYPDSFYSTNQDSTTVKNEYMPKWVKNVPTDYSTKVININGKEKITINKVIPNGIEMSGYFTQERKLQINTVYFPGWKIFVDGKEVPIDYNSNGLIRLNVPSGNHLVTSKFTETNLRLFADALSVIGTLIVTVLFLNRKLRKV